MEQPQQLNKNQLNKKRGRGLSTAFFAIDWKVLAV
jgi:hypothetical protein